MKRRVFVAIAIASLLTAACATAPSITAPSATVSSSNVEPSSTASGAAALRVVGLGDSYMTAVDSRGRTFLDLFAERYTAGTVAKPDVVNLASGDETSASLRDRLVSDASTRDAVSKADVIVISVGGNDSDPFGIYPRGSCAPGGSAAVCLRAYNPTLADNYEAMLTSVTQLRDGQPTMVIVTSADNPFTGWTEAPSPTFGKAFYRQVAEAETAAIFAAARRHGAATIDYLHAFTGRDGGDDPKAFLATDHAHPGERGIDVIASLLLAATRSKS